MADKLRPLTSSMDTLRTLLSESAAFRTWSGTQNAAAALARVYRVAVNAPDSKRPFACVGVPLDLTAELELRDADQPLNLTMAVGVLFEADATVEQDAAAALAGDQWAVYQPFAQAVDDIRQEVEEAGRNRAGAYYCITGSRVPLVPERAPVDEQGTLGRRLWCMVEFEMGVA